jgi:dTDP-glucose 4,6-dehydratase
VKTNVWGTLNVLRASAASGVERFVNISTDKAADPICMLGFTKRIAERLTADYDGHMLGISVRFGNVLGSQGSVMSTFEEQIRRGGPVTITHPEVSRYFMTIEEAVQLVVQAGALGRPGEVLVLDMGEPVPIVRLAEELIGEIEPGIEIPFVYTGLRQGEKLYEVLVGESEVALRKPHELISSYSVPPLGPETLGDMKVSMTDGEARATAAFLAGGTVGFSEGCP